MSGSNNHGKKFTAAEKHFMEKEAKLRKELKYAYDRAHAAEKEVTELREENAQLRKKIEELNSSKEEILAFSKLSKDDIDTLLEQAHNFKNFGDLLGPISRFMY